ncbi:MAG: undecaprenyl/decaprenyl-phosphate alpha-N-acetylglucosaminyl 1-phosphate transferase [Muribaculaceae bacterium]|nr:undecaprenyl/decaprenyl-phosphate alpha-N-acetylglucosaminyl 1-phosphate transferase [Muribaculaceae bacterium]
MNNWVITSFAAFVLSAFCAGILIPQILLVAFRKQLFDEPDQRKIHKGVVPRLGGIAFTPVICFTVSLILGIEYSMGGFDLGNLMAENARALCFGMCAILLLYLTGMSDDLIGVRYRAKLVIQFICAALLVAGDLWISNLHGILGIHEIPIWIGAPLTMVVMVYVVNAINLIDGIDGLASGLSAAALITYGTVFGLVGKPVYALLSFAALGVLVPFFYYNVFGNPLKRKKIFMGDTGSLTIGLLLSFLGLQTLVYSPETVPMFDTNVIIMALSPLIIPCFDVVRVFAFRLIHHGNPFLPDKSHIHHKLLAMGMPQRTAMVSIVIGAVFFSGLNIMLSRYLNVNALLLIDILVWTAMNHIVNKLINKTSAVAKDKAKN